MTNKPFAPTKPDIKEIAAIKELQEMWAAESAKEMQDILEDLYIAKFDFMNESPGYMGDLLIIIQNGVLGAEYPVVRLIRNRAGRLEILK